MSESHPPAPVKLQSARPSEAPPDAARTREGQREIVEVVEQYLDRSAELKRRTAIVCTEEIVRAAFLIADAFRCQGKVLLCGNGGSAADCQHMAAEFVSLSAKDRMRPGLPAIALTTDTSILTAYANDFGFAGVFARQVEALGRPADVLIAITTSGESENVIHAVAEAQRRGLSTIALTGEGGSVCGMVDVAIRVPSRDTQHVQETHLAIEHLLALLVERELYGAEVGQESRRA